MAVVLLSACGDDKPDEPTIDPDPQVPEITACNVSEGQEVDPDALAEIRITYNTTVALSKPQRITLNGRRITASVADSRIVVVPVKLEAATQYELIVPAEAVIANNGASHGPAYTLKFSTVAKTVEPSVPVAFAPLTNTNATKQAQNVYNFLIEQYGKKILSGAMANVNNNNHMADWMSRITGKYPALTGYDFIHLVDSKKGNWIDYSDITPAKTQWQNNGLVAYMWHWNVPDSKADYDKGAAGKYGFYGPGKNKGESETDFDIREALKEGTWQNTCILADIDKVAGYLKLLQDAGIPVLWRPLHEAAGDYCNGAWFWWGRFGDEYVTQLWKLMYDRLVKHHGLNNIIWVWTAQCQPGYYDKMKASYPGDEYVDIVGVDLYPQDDNSQAEYYKAALDMTAGRKLVSLSEIGRIPSPDKCMADGAYWSWFMLWYTYDIKDSASKDRFGNTVNSLKTIMTSPYILTRDQMPDLK